MVLTIGRIFVYIYIWSWIVGYFVEHLLDCCLDSFPFELVMVQGKKLIHPLAIIIIVCTCLYCVHIFMVFENLLHQCLCYLLSYNCIIFHLHCLTLNQVCQLFLAITLQV